jgi:hypothetical protein
MPGRYRNLARAARRNIRGRSANKLDSSGCSCRSRNSIRSQSCSQTDAGGRCSPSRANCTANSHTAHSDILARNPIHDTGRTCSLRRPGSPTPSCRRVRNRRSNLRSNHQAVARVSSFACNTVHNRAGNSSHMPERRKPVYRNTDCRTFDHISAPSFCSRPNTTAQARAREACVSSFPPKDHRSPPRAKKRRVARTRLQSIQLVSAA